MVAEDRDGRRGLRERGEQIEWPGTPVVRVVAGEDDQVRLQGNRRRDGPLEHRYRRARNAEVEVGQLDDAHALPLRRQFAHRHPMMRDDQPAPLDAARVADECRPEAAECERAPPQDRADGRSIVVVP